MTPSAGGEATERGGGPAPPRRPASAAAALAVLLALAAPLPAQSGGAADTLDAAVPDSSPGTLAGVLVRDSAAPGTVAGTQVALDGGRQGRIVDSTGVFRFPDVEPGEHRLTVSHVAFREREVRVRVPPGDTLFLRASLQRRVLSVEPLEVSVADSLRPGAPDAGREGGARAPLEQPPGAEDETALQDRGYVLAGVELRRARESARDMEDLIQELDVPGLVVGERRQDLGAPPAICIENRRAISSGDPCAPVQVYVNGSRLASAMSALTTIDVDGVRWLQYLPAAEAGARYGTGSAAGVLVIRTGGTRRP